MFIKHFGSGGNKIPSPYFEFKGKGKGYNVVLFERALFEYAC